MHRRAYLAAVGTAASTGLAGCSSALSVLGTTLYRRRLPHRDEPHRVSPSRVRGVRRRHGNLEKHERGRPHRHGLRKTLIPDDAEYFASGGYESQAAAYDAWDDRGGRLGTRETFEHTFEIPGTYEYFCIPHEGAEMTGEIVVSR